MLKDVDMIQHKSDFVILPPLPRVPRRGSCPTCASFQNRSQNIDLWKIFRRFKISSSGRLFVIVCILLHSRICAKDDENNTFWNGLMQDENVHWWCQPVGLSFGFESLSGWKHFWCKYQEFSDGKYISLRHDLFLKLQANLLPNNVLLTLHYDVISH